MTAHRDELGVVCTHGQLERVCEVCELTAERDALAARVAACTTHFHACDCREAEFAAKDKRIAELEAQAAGILAAADDILANRDELAALCAEVIAWMAGDGGDEFPWREWSLRARAAIGEGK